jgi:hypothetical protein
MQSSKPANVVTPRRLNGSWLGAKLLQRWITIRTHPFALAFALVLSGWSAVFGGEQILSASAPIVTERRAHENQVEYVAVVQDDRGQVFHRTNRYVVLATGLNRWDAARKAWVPASHQIQMVDGTGVARGAQHRVILASNTKSAGGLIDVETPQGERMVLQPVGLAVTDATGRSVFLAEIKESNGTLVDENKMVYPDAFDLLAGSICVTVTLDGVESDVILSERVDRGLLRRLDIDVETARLEVWHEVLRKPRLTKKIDFIKRRFGASDANETLEFGGMSISAGTAFTTGAKERLSSGDDLPVAKEFVRVEGVDFLIESVPFLEAERDLKDLPEPWHAAWAGTGKIELARQDEKSGRDGKQSDRSRPVSLSIPGEHFKPERQIAMASPTSRGYVIDYPITLTTQTNFTFRGDTTYYVTNRVLLYGTTRLEGGAVVKTVPYDGSVQAGIRILGDFECATSPLLPAIFTARDDNTVGETVADSTGVVATNAWYSHSNLMFWGANSVRLHDIQTKYGHVGVYFGTPGPHYLWNAQVQRCYRGIEAINATVHVRNALLHQTKYAINPAWSPTTAVHAEHLTIDTTGFLFGGGANGTLYLTNSLLSKVGNAGVTNVFKQRVEVVTNGVFKIAGGGRHYLAEASPYRNAGTSAVSPEMIQILKDTTTWAPAALSEAIIADTTLGPVAARDTDLPDLGFHYYPLDYLAGGIWVDAATLTLGSGVRVGALGANAFVLQNGATLVSAGDPLAMNALAPYNSIQSDAAEWSVPLEGLIRLATPQNRVELRFTECAVLANALERRLLVSGFADSPNAAELDVSHSLLANFVQPFRTLASSGVRLFNNIIENCHLHFEQGAVRGRTFAPLTLNLRHNLFHRGGLSFVSRAGSTPWVVRDNLFNSDSLSASGFNAAFAPDYNAFRIGLTIFGGANNRIGIDPVFQEGPLGPFYFSDESSIINLVNAGSGSALDAGLTHFTTLAAPLSREGDSRADIGFHYAAIDANGASPDTDGDGILDKDEDRNLDGRRDSGETSYLDRDTDMDGDSDPDELRMGTDPADSRSVRPRSLASWRFYGDSLIGVEGQTPLLATNTGFGVGIEDRGVDLSSTNGPVILQYRGLENDGRANVSLARGSFRIRLKTFWVSNDPALDIPGSTTTTYRGVGPQEWVTLIQTTNLAVRIDPDGTNIVVTSRTASGQTITNLQGRILQDSDQTRTNASAPAFSFWYDVLVTYSPEETKVFWGNPAEQLTGTGVPPWDGPSSANQFVSIGSAPDGSGRINAIIEDVVVYNVPGILQTNPWTFSSVALTNPAALNLAWKSKTNALLNVKRRPVGETNWSWLPGAFGTNFLDTNITVGQRYEYNLNSGFLASIGVREPFGNQMTAAVLGSAIESRGKVLLLVDESLQAALQPELNTFITNLVGDGWSVLSTNVPRHVDDYSSTEAFATNWFNITNRIAPAIRSQYALFSNQLKHILVIGHVTIPYTGEQADDGHTSASMPYGSHRGPWASDLYYSDIDGVWSDTRTITDSSFLENRNSPGDGKLDDDYIPANTNGVAEAEMTVARIDFARLPAFAESETELLKRYLRKNAHYRHKQLSYEPGAMSAELLFGFINLLIPHQIAAETASKLSALKPHDLGDVFAVTNSVVLAAQSGPGYVDRINDARPNMQTTAQFAANATAPNSAFYLLRSSFMQDWNLENNFMRAVLTPTNGGLAAGWFMSTGAWRIDPLAAGLELGSGWRETVSTRIKPLWGGQSARATQILGDSTLRYPVLAPPSGLTGVRANNLVNLTWAASPETNCTYNIYRSANGITSQFIRLNSGPLTTTSFSEPIISRAPQLYMVRALKVTENGSGSFTNLSQGVFISR